MASRPLIALCLALNMAAPVLAAETAPVFSGTDLNSGRQVSLEEHRGKVVFVDFWASWCPPCLVSLPAFDQMYREINDPGFEIIAVNVDEDTADGVSFLEQHPVSYPVLSDPEGKIGIPWNIRSLPRSFLLNQEGEIVQVYKRFKIGDEEQIKRAVKELLASSEGGG